MSMMLVIKRFRYWPSYLGIYWVQWKGNCDLYHYSILKELFMNCVLIDFVFSLTISRGITKQGCDWFYDNFDLFLISTYKFLYHPSLPNFKPNLKYLIDFFDRKKYSRAITKIEFEALRSDACKEPNRGRILLLVKSHDPLAGVPAHKAQKCKTAIIKDNVGAY